MTSRYRRTVAHELYICKDLGKPNKDPISAWRAELWMKSQA